MICNREVNVSVAAEITDWSNLKEFIFDISQPCSNMILRCNFGGKVFNCTEIFRPIITDNGLCCTFNMVDPKFMYRESINKSLLANNYHYPKGYEPVDWSAEAGYLANLPENFIPMKTVGIGESLGLSLTLDVESEQYYCSSSDSVGFKILLHNPLEVPNMREIGLLLSPGRETTVRIQTEKVESDRYVRYISKNSRRCLFENEMHLDFYNEYTQRNCVVECSADTLLAHCGCLPYFKPMRYGNETICDIRDTACVERVRLLTMLINKSGKGCAAECPSSCNDLSYLPTFFSAPLIHAGFQIDNQMVKNISSEYVQKNIAMVKIYFKDYAYRSEKNMDFIGVTDFLSNIGGIIGLFFGFSFISLAELVFYAILRPIRMLIVSQTYRFTRSVKLRRMKSVRPLFEKQSIGVLQQSNFYVQNALKRGRACQVAASREHLLGYEANKSNVAWQPGMEYTP
ncbi:PREDICTED: pickpocket protein 28-like [Rhagoletis zephyria]|uniref:pickpocket protein 28-like n=1 Tax=Rhagoletis zephyria TaxID=28612 RepID=UPI00081150B8|nr:PREDICTED: pickpocket protein 28-like [Rhagoletis zephyria]